MVLITQGSDFKVEPAAEATKGLRQRLLSQPYYVSDSINLGQTSNNWVLLSTGDADWYHQYRGPNSTTWAHTPDTGYLFFILSIFSWQVLGILFVLLSFPQWPLLTFLLFLRPPAKDNALSPSSSSLLSLRLKLLALMLLVLSTKEWVISVCKKHSRNFTDSKFIPMPFIPGVYVELNSY